MIMFFADIHLGHHLYHRLSDNNITTAEENTRYALEQILERFKKDDISFGICAGDIFNKPNPTTENIRFFIQWLKKVDAIKKPLYIITGNHDTSTYFNSLVFIKALHVSNIFLISEDTAKIEWGDWSIYFIPFLNSKTSVNKYGTTLEALETVMSGIDPHQNNMIVTHIQEYSSKIGSEGMMFAKSTDTVNLDKFKKFKKSLFLAGHMHMHQDYIKAESNLRVIYPGSLTHLELTDCNQEKGYLTISYDGTVEFNVLDSLRKFRRYDVPNDVDLYEFVEELDLRENIVVFLDVPSKMFVDTKKLSDILEKKSCSFGRVIFKNQEREKSAEEIATLTVSRDPSNLLAEYLDIKYSEATPEALLEKNQILKLGKSFLDQV